MLREVFRRISRTAQNCNNVKQTIKIKRRKKNLNTREGNFIEVMTINDKIIPMGRRLCGQKRRSDEGNAFFLVALILEKLTYNYLCPLK